MFHADTMAASVWLHKQAVEDAGRQEEVSEEEEDRHEEGEAKQRGENGALDSNHRVTRLSRSESHEAVTYR